MHPWWAASATLGWEGRLRERLLASPDALVGECGLDVASAKMGYRVDGIFPIGAPKASDPAPPWADEFDYRTLYVDLPENAGPVAETAFFHRPTATLVTTASARGASARRSPIT